LNPKRLTELALMTAIALIIFVIELQFPDIKIPGVKLGLANIVTVWGVFRYKPSEVAMVVFCRVILGAMFSGNIPALIYSISGSLMCLIAMIALRNVLDKNYIWLCSIIGAIFHNIGQIAAAVITLQSMAFIAYFPVLTLTGSIAGLFTGLCAQNLLNRLPSSVDKK